MAYDTVTAAFSTRAAMTDTDSITDCLPTLEQFVVLLYNRTSNEEVNQAEESRSSPRKAGPLKPFPQLKQP